jgi:hypothetical protein
MSEGILPSEARGRGEEETEIDLEWIRQERYGQVEESKQDERK